MTLPEPARTTWRQHREMLHEHARSETPPTRLMLGGGTILAARLKHRRSSDIDMFLPDIDSVDNWRPGGSLDLVKATAGTLEGLRKNRIIVRVTADSSFDVAAVRPKLPGTETEEDVDGRTETTLTNAQIILGKLFRTDEIVTRDAFDIVSVAKGDPRALEIAVNTLSSDELLAVRQNLFASNNTMAVEAEETLKGVSPEYQTDPRNLGRNASIATNTHRYQHVRILANDRGLSVETTTRARGAIREDHDRKLTRSRLQKTGIDQYMAANAAISSRKALNDLDTIAQSGWTGIVFDSNDRDTQARMDTVLREALEHAHRNTGDGSDNNGPGGTQPSRNNQVDDKPLKDEPGVSGTPPDGRQKTATPIALRGKDQPVGGIKPNVPQPTTPMPGTGKPRR